MSWIHLICESCWEAKNHNRVPHRVIKDNNDPDICCYCFKETNSWIYVRDNPTYMNCKCSDNN